MQEAKIGDRVSLITSKRIYFFQTAGGINLNSENQVDAVIPKTATEEHLAQINMAIKNGHLTIGLAEQKVEVPDRDSDIKVILEAGRNKIDDWIKTLREDKTVTNAIKTHTLEKLIEFEKAGKNRTSVVSVAERVLGTIGGVSPVIESEQEKLEIKLTSGNEENAEIK